MLLLNHLEADDVLRKLFHKILDSIGFQSSFRFQPIIFYLMILVIRWNQLRGRYR